MTFFFLQEVSWMQQLATCKDDSSLCFVTQFRNPPVFSPRLIYSLELTSNILWMVDALLYTIGMYFYYETKKLNVMV